MGVKMDFAISLFTMDCYVEAMALWKEPGGVVVGESDSEKAIRSYLDRNPNMSLIARDARGIVVGAVLCGHDGRRGYIYHLAVRPDSQRRGIGRRLVQECLSRLRLAGIEKCHVFILNDNTRGIDFWKSMGWTFRSDIGVVSKWIEKETGGCP
jgi:N-acetylglutamate synthase